MVTRYHCDDDITISEQPDGRYVEFEDYDALESKYETLKSSFKSLFETAECMLDRCEYECYHACTEECAKCEFTLDVEKARKIVNTINEKED